MQSTCGGLDCISCNPGRSFFRNNYCVCSHTLCSPYDCSKVPYIRNSVKCNNQWVFTFFKDHGKQIRNILIFNNGKPGKNTLVIFSCHKFYSLKRNNLIN